MKRTDIDGRVVQRLVTECVELAAGLDACARHARLPATALAARPLAEEVRALAEQLRVLGDEGAPRSPRTCERLRWEWLASTGALLDGAPDARLLAECDRLAARACEDASATELTADAEPLRKAAHALARALGRARRGLTAA